MNARGATITEMMVSTAVLSIGVVGLMGSFMGVQRALQGSKAVTLAANLSQEQMQILKQKVYYQILITTNPAYDANFTPNVEYDPGYFPPSNILEGGVTYKRYTRVQVAREDSGVIVLLPPSTPDTGMKLVTVTTVWKQGVEWKKLELRTIVANPDTVTANSIFNGRVRNANTFAVIPGAVASVAENLGWRDTTNASGMYTINLSPGNFTLGVVVPGYFPMHRAVSISGNQTKTEDFDLVPMSSGSATTAGAIWVNPSPVISQVVFSSAQYDTGRLLQFVEIHNPTPNAITVGTAGGLPAALKLKFRSDCSGAGTVNCTAPTYGVKLSYTNLVLPAYGHYLIANMSTFTFNGAIMTADAVYADDLSGFCQTPPSATYWNPYAATPLKQLAPTIPGNQHAGTFSISDGSDVQLDAVGWNHTSGGVSNSGCETSCIAVDGGPNGEQFVRNVSTETTSALLDSHARAYDSGANRVDFTTTTGGALFGAYSSASGIKPLLAGKVAHGAIVSANDGLSLSTRAYAVGTPPYARFALTQIATGTWTMLVSSGSWTLQHDTVTVAATGSVFTLPSTMTFLDTPNSDGFIEGTVTDALGNPLSPAIPVDPGGSGLVKTASTANGRYLLRVTPGVVDVVANSGAGASANYVSVSSLGISVALGEIHAGVDFRLSQGGRISGFVTRDGTNPLPGVAVTAIDSNGYSRDTQTTGSDGRFTTLNIATGAYTVELALDDIESSSPLNSAVTVTAGGNVSAGTFTVTGALGAITGSVSVSGQPLRTGALIVVTTTTLAGTPPAPPALSSATLTGSPYYLASSGEDGTYRVEVRQSTSTTYRVYAYYVTYPGGAPSISAQQQTNVGVLSGQTVSGVNFAW